LTHDAAQIKAAAARFWGKSQGSFEAEQTRLTQAAERGQDLSYMRSIPSMQLRFGSFDCSLGMELCLQTLAIKEYPAVIYFSGPNVKKQAPVPMEQHLHGHANAQEIIEFSKKHSEEDKRQLRDPFRNTDHSDVEFELNPEANPAFFRVHDEL
jgi:hypothetical protein